MFICISLYVYSYASQKGIHSSKSYQETREYWNCHKRREVNETMNSLLDAIYSEYKNNSHCQHCGKWNEFDDSICSECGRET